jgi:PEP-CTERM motif-containing protein
MREILLLPGRGSPSNGVHADKGGTMLIRLKTLKKLYFVGAASTLLLVSLPAAATVAAPLPEPDTLGLLAAGAIGGFVIWVRNRRKK